MILWKNTKRTSGAAAGSNPCIIPPLHRCIQPFRHKVVRNDCSSRAIYGGDTADIAENLLRNSDRQSSFWQCLEHQRGSQYGVYQYFLLPLLRLSPFAFCFSSSPASRTRCTYDLSHPQRVLSRFHVPPSVALRDEDTSKFREDGPTLIRYWFTSTSRLIIFLCGIFTTMTDPRTQYLHPKFFTRPKNDLEDPLKRHARDRESIVRNLIS